MSLAPQHTCWALIRAAAVGRTEAREEFTRRYLPAVRAFLSSRWRHTFLRSEIDDAVQEVFIACFKKRGALENVETTRGSGFRRFLLGVARNVALHFERTAARRAARVIPGLEEESQVPADDIACSRAYDRAYARSLMREAAERMAAQAQALAMNDADSAVGHRARQRVQLLKLRFEEGLPIRDIARMWSVDAQQLYREYARAGREFKASLRHVVGLAERCAPEHLERECDRLLRMLRG